MTPDEAVEKAVELLPRKVLALYVGDEDSRATVYGLMAAHIFAQANGLGPVKMEDVFHG